MRNHKIIYIVLISIFFILPLQVSAMQVYVEKETFEKITIEVETSDTIEAVKEKIYQVDNTLLPKNQKLFFEDKELENIRTIGDYLIKKENTIHLIMALETINIKYNLENLNVITDNVTPEGNLGDNNFIVSMSNDLTAKLEALAGYKIPSKINIKIKDNTIDTDKYTYNSETGEILINKEIIDGDIVINASAVKAEYKVIFNASGGTFKNDKEIIEIENIIDFNYKEFEKPTRDGYEFVGFYTEENSGKSFEDVMNSEAGIEKDTTFYARWQSISQEENPETLDGIITSLFMGIVSLITLVGTIVLFKKKSRKV